VSIPALAVLVMAVLRGIEIQAGVVALVVLAVLPWLTSIVESVEFPGGGSLRLVREVQEKVQRQGEQLSAQEKQLDVQQEVITQLVLYSMSWYLFDLLSKLYHRSRSGEEYLFRDNESTKGALRFLRDHGYLAHFNITELRDGENLIGKIRLTPVGNFFVEHRERLQAQQAADVR
jgi:hypothetical protein